MSQHHRAQKWTTHSPKLRKLISPMLPLPCIECGHAVTAEMTWQVGHRRDAMDGGVPTLENCGPVHSDPCPWCKRKCNQSAGGKRGAAVTNRGRKAQTQIDRGMRRWV